MHRKTQIVAKIIPLHKDHSLLTLRFNLSTAVNYFMFFLMRQKLGRQTVAKCLRNA